jgi:uncharacterized protein (TIGR03435 family)
VKCKRIGLALALAILARAQTFEVASVKLSPPETRKHCGGGPGTADPGQFHCNVVSLLGLISVAYHVDHFQVESKALLDRDRYDVAAKIPAGTSREQFRVMMQNLLAQRLHLKLHKEARDFAGYELTVAKGGAKLKESSTDCGIEPDTRKSITLDHGVVEFRIAARRETMSGLAEMLQVEDDSTPIADKTGLTGLYDFQLVYTQEIAEYATTSARALSTALIRQLGLQLVPKKLRFEVLVVESFDRTPVE